MTQSIQEQIRSLATIESEFHFLQIGREVLCRNLVPRTHDSALQKGERGFNRVRVNVALHVDVPLVPNRLVLSSLMKFLGGFAVLVEFIGEKHVHVLADVFFDELAERTRLYVLSVKEPEFAAALPDADHYFLVFVPVLMSASGILSADVGFVHLYLARQHRPVGLHHGVSDAMAEVPSGFVADSNGPLNLTGRNSFLRLTEQERRKKPCFQRQVGIVEDGSSGHSKLVITVLAVEKLLVGFEFHGWHLAAWTLGTGRPAEPDKQLPALFVSREQGVYVH